MCLEKCSLPPAPRYSDPATLPAVCSVVLLVAFGKGGWITTTTLAESSKACEATRKVTSLINFLLLHGCAGVRVFVLVLRDQTIGDEIPQ